MTGVRQSFVFCREADGFDTGKSEEDKWVAPPPGSFFSSTHTRSVTKVYTEGSKFPDTFAYGQLSGSWEWTFLMDYDYLEPLLLAFEGEGGGEDVSSGVFEFTKANNRRVPSFCVRGKILNRITDGAWESGLKDETYILTGCVVKTIRFSKSAGASQVQVSMSGFYANEHMDLGNLDSTDYVEYEGHLVEFQCMFAGDEYVANTESLSVGVENTASAIYTTCTPIASNFAEGQASLTFGTMCYSNDPTHYKTRMYSGGRDKTALYPNHKNLGPIPLVTLKSYNAEQVSYDENGGCTVDFDAAWKKATRTAEFRLTGVAIKGLTRQKGDGSKLQDQINSTDILKIVLAVKSPAYAALKLTSRSDVWSKGPHTI